MNTNLPSILVVDDNADNLVVIESILSNVPVRLLLANSGEQALSMLVSEMSMPALALLDVQMPGMDGYELAKLLRSVQRTREIPIIFLSAVYRDETHIMQGYDSGAIDYLIKPVNDDLLRSKVKVFLELASFKQQAAEQVVLQVRQHERDFYLAELARREHDARSLIDNNKALVWMAGRDKACDYFNEHWLSFTGRTLEQELGNGWAEGVHPDDFMRCLETYVSNFDAHAPFSMEYRIRHVSGEYRWIIDYGSPRYNNVGEFIGYIGFCYDISERKQHEAELLNHQQTLEQTVQQRTQELQQERQRLIDILWATDVGTWEWNVQTGESHFNEHWAKILGYTLAELEPLSFDTWTKLTHPNDAIRAWKVLEQYFAGESDRYECEIRMRHKAGHWVWVLDRGRLVSRTKEGKPLWMSGTHLDISERKSAENQLKQAASVFESSREGILIADALGNILDVNRAFTQITGYEHQEVIGQNPRILSSGKQDALFYQQMWDALGSQGYWHGEIWNRRKNGEVYAELLTISSVRDVDGSLLRYVALFSDISHIKEQQKQLEQIAHYDALTQLPNRLLLSDRLQQAMIHAIRQQQQVAVVYLDLDGFKAINDQYGHGAGDFLLIKIAERMKLALRDSDTLARLGGDEFVAVLPMILEHDCGEAIFNRLLAAANEGVLFGEQTLQVSASLGVTFYPQKEEITADQLLRQADQAMYQAKQLGKNRYQLFDINQEEQLRLHYTSLAQIRNALHQQQLVLYYQPKVNMGTGEVLGVEALIRWQHPERGLLPPAAFLPQIEGSPFMMELGNWVLCEAMQQFTRWYEQGLSVPISINIDGNQLKSNGFIDLLRRQISSCSQFSAGDLELEVLESSALSDMDLVSQRLSECQELGVNIALDDFGSGYSSLGYLKRLPAQLIKIDQGFVRDMLEDEDDLSIIEAVVGLAHAFDREVIAEGVETEAHGQLLLQLGCEYGQGYVIARPMPAEHIPNWIQNWHPPDSWLNMFKQEKGIE